MSDEDDVMLLESLRDTDVPSSDGVSVARAVRAGKRAKALRVSLVAVVVLVVAGLVPLAMRPDVPEPVATQTFDPLIRTISMPPTAGYRPIGYWTERDRQVIDLAAADGTPSLAGSVSVWATGHEPTGEPMPDVHGRRAVWTGKEVAWEWRPGSWAYVEVTPGPDSRGQAHQVALSVATGQRIQVLVPFTVQTRLALTSVQLYPDGDSPWARLWLERDVGVLVIEGGKRVSVGGGEEVSAEEKLAIEKSVRPADPPVANPIR